MDRHGRNGHAEAGYAFCTQARPFDFAQGDRLGKLLRQGEEIGKDFLPFLRENGFGVELDAPDGVLFVADAHDFAFGFGFGGDLEGVGHGVAFDEERMIAGGVEGVGHAGEEVVAVVVDGRGFAVHEAVGADDFAAEDVAHALVAEADAEGGDVRAESFDDVVGQAGFARGTRAGGNEDARRV